MKCCEFDMLPMKDPRNGEAIWWCASCGNKEPNEDGDKQ